jgi:glutamate decarboxylase
VQRIIVRHGLSIDMADLLLNDFRSGTEEAQEPSAVSLPLPDEGTSYNHDAVAAIPPAVTSSCLSTHFTTPLLCRG